MEVSTNATKAFDGTVTAGRKGIPYDWQSLFVAAEASALEFELVAASITPEYAE